ncbi:MAG: SWIM zinc finger family protein [Myxococcales bacterium]|nr:SWIM zinc finger family protein [Myxococcales bacterium]
MTDTTDKPEVSEGTRPEDDVRKTRTSIDLRYKGASQVVPAGTGSRLALFCDERRADVRVRGRVQQPLRLREALSALYDVVSSDFRYVPKDRTAYLAYMRMRKQTATMDVQRAQQAYFDWMARNDPYAWLILDPVVTVHPDALIFEVFSKDEGTYAKLDVDWAAFELDEPARCGTTNVDYSKALFEGVQRMRSYRETRISIGRDAVALQTEGGGAGVVEKKIQVPDTWLRGFLQVQSAATLPWTRLRISAIDLYNVLRQLRLHADQKRKGRGVRVELSPGEPPRLVLEPWEVVIETSTGPYKGRTAGVFRIWGRRRLMLLRRMLPFIDSVDIYLLGSGLPSFYVLRAGAFTFTLALTGFTSANWAQAVNFDLLLPRARTEGVKRSLESIVKILGRRWFASATDIMLAVDGDPDEIFSALQLGCQHGVLMYDLARDVYRLRPLVDDELDLDRIEYRNARERVAHDLVEADAVTVATENRVYGVGLELTGKVNVVRDHREYRPQLVVDDDGRVKKAVCTCAFYRRHKLKEGPCAHLIALRVRHAREEERRRALRGRSRAEIDVETRTYARRRGGGEEIFQLSLDRRRLKLRWGPRRDASFGGEGGGARSGLRVQTLVFNSVADARAAYFDRVEQLEARGYLDATAG